MHSVTTTIAQDQRGYKDRRCVTTSPFSRIAWRGRRRDARRGQDAVNTHVDLYQAHWFYAAIGVLLLCCTDAVLTLNLIQNGASEINPFMAWLLSINQNLFFFTKVALTATGVIVLVAYKNFCLFNYFKVGHVLYAFLAGYALLIKYELILLSM